MAAGIKPANLHNLYKWQEYIVFVGFLQYVGGGIEHYMFSTGCHDFTEVKS